VIGTGPDRVFPARHRMLAHRIAGAGAVVSEYPPGVPPLKENFPARNRLIAGLSQGTLVVEAALASGSLITARQAAEAGREVFAIPGSIHSPQSRGCHALIRQGAKLVETAEDIVEELRGAAQPPLPLGAAPPGRPGRPPRTAASKTPTGMVAGAAEPPTNDEDPLLAALGHDPVTLDALLARTGESAAVLSARLLELELAGRVARLPGGLYQRLFTG
jgi:DNA processing protein